MPLPELKHPGYTLEDWQTWEGRWELIHGVAYAMTPAPSTHHQSLSSDLHGRIWATLKDAKRRHGGDCQLFAAPTDVYLFPDTVVQPDLLVVCDPAKTSPRGIEGAPDLVVEILSPSSVGKDMTTKRWLYESAKVPEYLIVYPDENSAELLALGDNGLYRTVYRVPLDSTLALLTGRIQVNP